MQVWVVEFGWDYEGAIIAGVFASESEAEAYCAHLESIRKGDYQRVTDYEVGKRCVES